MSTMDGKGEDEVGGTDHAPEEYHDAEDGNCINGNGKYEFQENENDDEGDALGRPGGRPGEVYAPMPVPKYATHYKMNHPKRGLALIFNHEVFECGGLKSRSGTNEDCNNLKLCLSSLGFEVMVFKDLIYTDLESQVRAVSKMDHTNHDCVMFAILSHGEMNIVYAKDTPYKPESLWSLFTADKCPSLAGKPKMFFLQACQGDKLDGGVHLHTTETDGDMHNTYKIPVQADFLIVYSTVKGSWFVQALCEELRQRAHELDLMTILTFVSQRVAMDFESNVPDSITMHRQKQIPCVMSMLTRLIQFNVPGSNLDSSVAIKAKKPRKRFSGIFKT
ncbi:caspase-1-like isoform X2 [Sitophilus oryzae]|uniref:Caspase-1-like isoform X2 n=1 Tax=Sitophilus oryzae TaxID=7048 RepID=A0A6J2Y8J3_SITOR|nr:caspase-1-like isoform X2 [Sitophilus oryzae]